MEQQGKSILLKIKRILNEIDGNSQKDHTPSSSHVIPDKKASFIFKDLLQSEDPKRKGSPRTSQPKHLQSNLSHQHLLHGLHNQKLLKQASQRQDQLVSRQYHNKSFTMTNKRSIFLNGQKKLKPIHQRSQEILIKKQNAINKKKTELALKHKQAQDEDDFQLSKCIVRKMTQKELRDVVGRAQEKNKERAQKTTLLKLSELQYHVTHSPLKPKINEQSHTLFRHQKLKRNLSSNILLRFEQYQENKVKNIQKTVDRINKQERPFTPRVSQNSRIITERSPYRYRAQDTGKHELHSCRQGRAQKLGSSVKSRAIKCL